MFDGVTLPFTSGEMLTAVFDFIKLLGPYILIGIALAFTPRVVAVIKSAATGRGGGRA